MTTRALKPIGVCSTLIFLVLILFVCNSANARDIESLGPSNRRTPLVISEIMYHPLSRTDGLDGEFIEIYNSQLWDKDLGGFRLEGAVEYQFPASIRIPPETFLVIAKVPEAVRTIYGIQDVLGPYQNRLDNGGETLRLLNQSGAVLFEVSYQDRPPWPLASDGAGHSLVLARPSFGESEPRAWEASDRIGGSPGKVEGVLESPLPPIQINEVWRHPTRPGDGFIELFNQSSEILDISDSQIISNFPDETFHISEGTSIGPSERLLIGEQELGFDLHRLEISIHLLNPEGSRVIDSVLVGPHDPDVSYGRLPETSANWRLLSTPTPGTDNTDPWKPDIIFNEIMFHPISEEPGDEYFELFNRGNASVDMGGWQIDGDVRFQFPTGTILSSGQYLVVAKDIERLRSNHPHLNSSNSFGDLEGRLSNRGQQITLSRLAQWPLDPGEGVEAIGDPLVLVDEVNTLDRSRWSQWADGGGSSLELKDPNSDNDFTSNWADSDESAKSEWTIVDFTGDLERVTGINPRSFQILLLGSGECLVDDVELFKPGGTDPLDNGDFEVGSGRWVFQGNHVQTDVVDSLGIGGSRTLKVKSSGRGDPHSNRIRTTFSRSDLTAPGQATIRAKVRWLKGHSEILFRLQGNFVEVFQKMLIPTNLGTPGLRNSRWENNAGPVIRDVRHFPVVPNSEQPVTVTARIRDADGVGEVRLNYRIDLPGSETVELEMKDDGIEPDVSESDGIYSAVIPGQLRGRLVAFYVEAHDDKADGAASRFPENSPEQECLIRFGDPPVSGGFGVYRMWLTRDTLSRWNFTSRPNASNEPLDATFIYNDERIIYNVGASYSGSFFNSPRYDGPLGRPCDYALRFSKDDSFLGATKIIVSWPGLTGNPDPTLQREQFSYWLADQLDLPFNYRRYVVVFANGRRRNSVMEDTQRPNGDMLRQWFPNDTGGDLHKIQIHYESNDSANDLVWESTGSASLELFLNSEGAKRTSAYRWNWAPQNDGVSANHFDNLFRLVDAVNILDQNQYVQTVSSLVDIEQWMRTFALEHIVGNWDSYGYGNGQNMYTYKPPGGKWQMMMWDLDIGNGSGESSGTPLFKLTNPFFPTVNGDTEIVGRMYQTPAFVRAFWRALEEAVNGPMIDTRVDGILDAKLAVLRSMLGTTAVSSPSSISSYIRQRRDYILRQLDRVSTDFAVTTPEGAQFSTDQTSVILSGTAPVGVHSIRINGVTSRPTWTEVNRWELDHPLSGPHNELLIEGYGLDGNPLEQASATLTVEFTGDQNQLPPKLVINEWMALNQSTIADPVDGDFDDWLELYNAESVELNLTGFALTDDLKQPAKWVFPPETKIASGGYLLVWADGETEQNESSESLHAGFQINGDGELMALFDPEGSLLDLVRFSKQTADISMGRILGDSSGEPMVLSIPTPGKANPVDSGPSFRILGIQHSAPNSVVLQWETQPGKTYQVQFKESLEVEVPWADFGSSFDAQESAAQLEFSVLADQNPRFYRVVMMP